MKNKIITIIFIIILVGGMTIHSFAVSQSDKDALERKINESQEKLDDVKEEKSKELQEIENLDNQITTYENEIESLNEEISILQDTINQKTIEIEKKQKEHDEKEALLEQRIVALYEAGDTSFLDVLFSSDNLIDFISNYYMVQQIAQYDTDLINRIQREKEEIEQERQEIEEQQKQIKEKKETKQAKSNELSSLKKQKQTKVNQLSDSEKQIQSDIDDYKEQIAKVNAQLQKAMEDAVKNDSYSGNKFTGGKMTWPIPGYYHITSGPGPRWGTHHDGIDIATNGEQNKPVLATVDGQVIIVYDQGATRGYGKYIAINHGNGYSTLYAHLNKQMVSVGQIVKAGQQIGLSGNTGRSTGPHLHFEVRQGNCSGSGQYFNAKVLDPENFF